MKLKEYLDKFKDHPEYDMQHWMKSFGIARATLWKALQGKKMDIEVAVKIQKATSGIVTCEDLTGSDERNDHADDKSKKQQQQNDAASNTPVRTESNV